MDAYANSLIDALGGVSAVSRMIDTPVSTVGTWRRKGIPKSRLSHIKLAAAQVRPDVNLERIGADHAAADTVSPVSPETGNDAGFSAQPQEQVA